MPINALKAFLEEQGVGYEIIPHHRAYTAQETAAAAHIPGQELAKTVIAKVGDQMVMCVMPASYRVDFELLREVIGAQEIELATEKEFRLKFIPRFCHKWRFYVFSKIAHRFG